MSKTIIESPSDLYDLVGTTLGPSPSMEITQERINQFADATGDHQWIHIDAERAPRVRLEPLSPTVTSRCRWPLNSCQRSSKSVASQWE